MKRNVYTAINHYHFVSLRHEWSLDSSDDSNNHVFQEVSETRWPAPGPRVCTTDLHSTGGTEGKERKRHIYSWENMSLFQVTNEISFIVR